jgi:hypothetical protein
MQGGRAGGAEGQSGPARGSGGGGAAAADRGEFSAMASSEGKARPRGPLAAVQGRLVAPCRRAPPAAQSERPFEGPDTRGVGVNKFFAGNDLAPVGRAAIGA